MIRVVTGQVYKSLPYKEGDEIRTHECSMYTEDFRTGSSFEQCKYSAS